MRYAFRTEAGRASEAKARFIKRCRFWMKKRIEAKNGWHCWVAESDGHLVGNIWVQLIEKIPNPVAEPELHAYLTNFYVARQMRGKQVGTRLLRAALSWCRRKEVDAIILWPSPASRSLYLRHGFARGDEILNYVDRRQ